MWRNSNSTTRKLNQRYLYSNIKLLNQEQGEWMEEERGVLLRSTTYLFQIWKAVIQLQSRVEKDLSLNCSSSWWFPSLLTVKCFFFGPLGLMSPSRFFFNKPDLVQKSFKSGSSHSSAVWAILVPRLCIAFSLDLNTCESYFFGNYIGCEHALSFPRRAGNS